MLKVIDVLLEGSGLRVSPASRSYDEYEANHGNKDNHSRYDPRK
jgi:hypothetical protein